MIEIAFEDKTKLRVEGARVILPGYEYLEAYATHYTRWKGTFDYDKWMIAEARSGHLLHTHQKGKCIHDKDTA